MSQISVPFAEKLDGPLAQLCNGERGLSPSARFPVIVRYQGGALAEVSERVAQLGGTIRHKLSLLSAIAAWIPLSAIEQLAKDDDVREIELSQEFTIA